ncbi:hypothetical protein NDU88_010398 [Pleurodeles waltl]|uniref:Uncharacterized protein n=1 Tax=Pleurodeles waltl TaxID=8319 RepID=A0AAV7S3W0_PLEWA|nr:hypothetical protein NDU88_010398 [Pleurodeles waltl]
MRWPSHPRLSPVFTPSGPRCWHDERGVKTSVYLKSGNVASTSAELERVSAATSAASECEPRRVVLLSSVQLLEQWLMFCGLVHGSKGNEALDYSVANREKPYFILGRYA